MTLQLEDLDERRQAELLADALTHAEKSGQRSLMLRVRVEDERRHALAGDSEALARARELVADLEATGDGEAVASSLLSLVGAAKDPATALDLAEAAAAAFEREGAGRWRGVALHTAGVAAGASDRDRSVELLRAARAVAADERFVILETACVSALARLSWQSGELDDAERLMRETVALAERGGIDATPAYADLGDILVDAEHWSALATTARDELRHAQRSDDRRAVALAQRHLGLALHETGRHAEGAEILETARPVLRDYGLPAYAPTCWALGKRSQRWATTCRPQRPTTKLPRRSSRTTGPTRPRTRCCAVAASSPVAGSRPTGARRWRFSTGLPVWRGSRPTPRCWPVSCGHELTRSRRPTESTPRCPRSTAYRTRSAAPSTPTRPPSHRTSTTSRR